MLDLIAHRGPDGRSVKTIGSLNLGHVRLAIQDLDSRADQPMTVDGVTVAYNGEAWNVNELRAEFPNRKWATTSDTEPIAALIARDGATALNKIDGMFAIAWHDGKSAYLARDRYGKVPLYWTRVNDGVVFASELKALPRGVRANAVQGGTTLDLASLAIEKWTVPVETHECNPENVLAFLKDGVRQRMLSDRPVCFLLSGGLDSSLVLALGREFHPDPVAYTAVYDKQSEDLLSARRIAAHFDVPLVEVQVPEPTNEAVQSAVRTVENPMKAQVEIALAHAPLMAQIASDGFRVALSGEAADELFIGYGNMAIATSRAQSNHDYQTVIKNAVDKMGRGNFMRVNKVMMASSVEGRLPFMEERLVQMALKSNRATNPPGKKVVKEAARDILPEWAIKRVKQTFQGGTGIAKAVGALSSSPVRWYNAEATTMFGYLPRN